VKYRRCLQLDFVFFTFCVANSQHANINAIVIASAFDGLMVVFAWKKLVHKIDLVEGEGEGGKR